MSDNSERQQAMLQFPLFLLLVLGLYFSVVLITVNCLSFDPKSCSRKYLVSNLLQPRDSDVVTMASTCRHNHSMVLGWSVEDRVRVIFTSLSVGSDF